MAGKKIEKPWPKQFKVPEIFKKKPLDKALPKTSDAKIEFFRGCMSAKLLGKEF